MGRTICFVNGIFALLAAEALGLGYRDAPDPDLVERLLHLVELEGLDDRFDFLNVAAFFYTSRVRTHERVAARARRGRCPAYRRDRANRMRPEAYPLKL